LPDFGCAKTSEKQKKKQKKTTKKNTLTKKNPSPQAPPWKARGKAATLILH